MSDEIKSRLETVRAMAEAIRHLGGEPCEMRVQPEFYRDLCAEMGCEVGTLTEVDGVRIGVVVIVEEDAPTSVH